ncbi:hypothetical protein E8E13_002692 [Curvularia kusanoi]|uniref:Uncharacterized protein n=1 Tax=Curvularia kusanoi TaxID=90978 RepID=A0A9P4TFX6_CURKU|nr:hypothetical protein E8E13_002692 [Curvularia kusanoi]
MLPRRDHLEILAAKLAELPREGRTEGEPALAAIKHYRITSLLMDEQSGNGTCMPFETIDAVLHQSEETFKLDCIRPRSQDGSRLPYKFDASRP